MNTKGFNSESIEKYVRVPRMEPKEGRAELVPEMQQMLYSLIADVPIQ